MNLQLPDPLYWGLGRSLVANARDYFLPEKLPPLLLTSRPVDVGMLLGDRLALPWTRTIFTNLGDVITPETLPPLELESRPVDVGELIGDQLSHGWWSSLLRGLADAVAPERMPALELTSAPVNPTLPTDVLILPRWSALITGPRLPMGQKPKPLVLPPLPRPAIPKTLLAEGAAAGPKPEDLEAKRLKKQLRGSRFREVALVAIALTEIIYLAVSWLH